MGNIYKHAVYVLACVGAHSHDSEFLVDFCNKNERLLKNIFDFSLRFRSTLWALLVDIDESKELTLRCLCRKSSSTRLRMTEAFLAFMGRPYFSWLSVLQELYMGRRVIVCCDAAVIPAEQLLALHSLLNPFSCPTLWRAIYYHVIPSAIRNILWNRLKYKPSLNSYDRAVDFMGVEVRVGCLYLAVNHSGLKSLHTFLDVIEYFTCADNRDKLYGILSLIDWSPNNAPRPDYRRDHLDLALEVFQLMVREPEREYLNDYLIHADYAVSLAGRLTRIFDLPIIESEKMAHLKTRYTSSVNSGDLDSVWHNQIRICDPAWNAVRISAQFSNDWDQIYFKESGSSDDFVTLFDASGAVFAQGPLDMIAGDWYAQMVPYFIARLKNGGETPSRDFILPEEWNRIGMIVRETDSTHLTIVGLDRSAVYRHIASPGSFVETRDIHIHWDLRDVLLTYLTIPNANDVDLNTLTTVRVCGSEESSFAIFPSADCHSRLELDRKSCPYFIDEKCSSDDLNGYNPNEAPTET
ncbi:hypothetical protein IQ06DRAFT_300436 [Phaeosphaeriaceae sp. SRC1lsM3a]|nr:hypothetical protein IQ06DRAFT_300436 [Stagonospora sp. SRC1lsM3a]